MIKQLLAVDGVMAICHFRDDGALVEGYGMPDDMLAGFAKFAHDYKRLVLGNADQLSMFTRAAGLLRVMESLWPVLAISHA